MAGTPTPRGATLYPKLAQSLTRPMIAAGARANNASQTARRTRLIGRRRRQPERDEHQGRTAQRRGPRRRCDDGGAAGVRVQRPQRGAERIAREVREIRVRQRPRRELAVAGVAPGLVEVILEEPQRRSRGHGDGGKRREAASQFRASRPGRQERQSGQRDEQSEIIVRVGAGDRRRGEPRPMAPAIVDASPRRTATVRRRRAAGTGCTPVLRRYTTS